MRVLVPALVALALSAPAMAESQTIKCPAPRGAAGDGISYQSHTFVLTNVAQGDPPGELRRKVRVAGWNTSSAQLKASRLMVEAERAYRFDTLSMRFAMDSQHLYASKPITVEIDYCLSECVTKSVTCTSTMNYR